MVNGKHICTFIKQNTHNEGMHMSCHASVGMTMGANAPLDLNKVRFMTNYQIVTFYFLCMSFSIIRKSKAHTQIILIKNFPERLNQCSASYSTKLEDK